MARQKSISLLVATTLISLFCGISAQASEAYRSCWPGFTSTNTDLRFEEKIVLPLESENIHGRYELQVKLALKSVEGGMSVIADYSLDENQYGLPFHIYSLMITKNGKMLFYEDFTNGCSNVGVDLFPNQVSEIAKIKGEHSPKDIYKVILWGQ